jgi:DNA invertase Pin-like site-specific DNA recombinase
VSYRAVIVAAVSTPSQAADDRYSIPAQIADARATCERAGWSVVAEVVVPGHSRDYVFLHELVTDCPEYAELVHLIERDQVDLVVCRHYDRLWRNDWIRADVMCLATLHTVQVYSIEQPRPPRAPETLTRRAGLAAVMEVLSGSISEEEQAIRIQRHRVGMRGRVAAGRHHPGPRAPYGYMRDTDGALACNEPRAYWLRYLFERRAVGHSASQIAADLTRLGVATPGRAAAWHARTINRILTNDVYVGVARWGEYANPNGLHPALVDRDLFDRVQVAMRSGRARFPGTQTYSGNWLAGLVRCGHCRDAGRNWAMQYYKTQRASKALYLRCGYYVETSGQGCQNNGHSGRRVHAYVLDSLVEALADPDAWLAARHDEQHTEQTARDLAQVRAAIADNRRRWERWSGAYEAGSISLDELVTHRSRLDAEHTDLQRHCELLGNTLRLSEATAERIGGLTDMADTLRTAPPGTQREIANVLLRAVVLRRGSPPELEWW